MFFWYQVSEDNKAWAIAASSDRASVLSKIKPAYVTVLDASDEPQEGWTREDFLKVKYSGPLYFDWDAEDCADTIPDFKSHLAKLMELGLDLQCTRIYATGGRGFHLEIPQACFMERVPREGVAQLPYIYKEMARQFQSDTMDMRIYTGRRGRMWRSPGVQRSNGRYKVQITPEEALAITPESYAALTSTYRPPLAVAEPASAIGLKPIFLQAKRRIESEVKRTRDSKKDAEALKAFNGAYPPAVVGVMRGTGYNTSAGFNQIALQLAIVANALGKSEEQFLADCDGFIQLHQGDGQRYASPGRRRKELREMFWYVNGDDCYAYSVGAIKNICSDDVTQFELTGKHESEYAPWDETLDTSEPEAQAEESKGEQAVNFSKYDGIRMNRQGIFIKKPDAETQISDIAFLKPRVLKEIASGKEVGFVVDVVSRGNRYGQAAINMDSFKSRSSFDAFCAGFGTNFRGTDQQAGIIRTVLSERAEKGGNMHYVVHKEGLDLVQDPSSETPEDDVANRRMIPVWVSEGQVFQDLEDGKEAEYEFTYRPHISKRPFIEADIHKAPALKNDAETVEYLRSILSINEAHVVANVLGWFVSCYHRMHYHYANGQFPLLHIVGQAGSGKSKTAELFGHLHHVFTKPKMVSAGISTVHSIKVAMITSASAPVILEEYKPAEMDARKYNSILQSLRLAYNCGAGATGGVPDGSADTDYRSVGEYTFSTPVCFLAEARETQAAIQQRCITVAVSSAAHNPDFERVVFEAPKYLSQVGGEVFKASLKETVASRREALNRAKAEVRRTHPKLHDRMASNLAVILAGLDFIQGVLARVLGDTLDEDFARLRLAALQPDEEMTAPVMSEVGRVLNAMAFNSRTEDPDSLETIKEGRDYMVKDQVLEILPRDAYMRYLAWAKRRGQDPLFKSPEAFIFNLTRHEALVDKNCVGSPLRTVANQKVFRLSLDLLGREGVEDFKCKAQS